MSQAKALYRLQKLDLELDTRRARVSQINATLEQDSVLRQAQAEVGQLREALRPKEVRAAELNQELQMIDHQAAQLGERLYGGGVNNPKELEEIQSKIAERKRRHADLEEVLLETMIAIDELQASLDQAARNLAEVQASRASDHQVLIDEMQRLKEEIKAIKVNRKTAEEQVSPENLELYQTLRPKKQGHVVSPLDGEACSRCCVDQTTTLVQQVRQDQSLIMCENCGRILVAL
jgi:predicted  nucleic acid-binding Zn-ribbon protein